MRLQVVAMTIATGPQIDPSRRLAEGRRMLKRSVLAIAALFATQTYADLIAQLAHRPWLALVLVLIGTTVVRLLVPPKGETDGRRRLSKPESIRVSHPLDRTIRNSCSVVIATSATSLVFRNVDNLSNALFPSTTIAPVETNGRRAGVL